ncbi:GrpB family protein [Notoacmeibacter marinus]|uniref:GrpB family protein n=1 Tax=Notoacmeibacter marinus TaxID=1876515 RepID=UPI0013B0635F|nr:GrpB family protein [Notoacmeibacter marinus]
MTDKSVLRLRDTDRAAVDHALQPLFAVLRECLPTAEAREVGSTAVPELVGKGDVDVLVRVPLADFAAASRTLEQRFACNEDQHASATFRSYLVSPPKHGLPPVTIQMTAIGASTEVFDAFLAVLRTDETMRERYGTLKRSWEGRGMAGYRRAKARFIRNALRGSETPDRGL